MASRINILFCLIEGRKKIVVLFLCFFFWDDLIIIIDYNYLLCIYYIDETKYWWINNRLFIACFLLKRPIEFHIVSQYIIIQFSLNYKRNNVKTFFCIEMERINRNFLKKNDSNSDSTKSNLLLHQLLEVSSQLLLH